MPHVVGVLVRGFIVIAVVLGLLSTVVMPLLLGLALTTVRVIPRRERVDVAALDAFPCGIAVGAALAGSCLALGTSAVLAGALLLAMLALASAFRWRVRCTRAATEVARTFVGLPWRRRLHEGRARLEETGWGDASDPAAIEVRVGTAYVCALCWILRNQGERATRVLQRADALLARL